MEQQREKQTASDHMYVLLETLSQRKENGMDAHSRSDEGEKQRCYRCGLHLKYGCGQKFTYTCREHKVMAVLSFQ